MRELYPVQGGATEGFEFKWVQNGQTYRVRVHNVDPSAPVGSNAYNGWVVRVQRGRRYLIPMVRIMMRLLLMIHIYQSWIHIKIELVGD